MKMLSHAMIISTCFFISFQFECVVTVTVLNRDGESGELLIKFKSFWGINLNNLTKLVPNIEQRTLMRYRCMMLNELDRVNVLQI